MKDTRFLLSICIGVLILFLSVSVVWAATRTTNGSFEDNVAGWDGPSPPSQDADVSHVTSPTYNGSAGAAQLENLSQGGGFLGRIGQCVSLTSPVTDHFVVRGHLFVPASVNNFDGAYIRVQFFTGAGCAPHLGFLSTPEITAATVVYDDWNTLELIIPLTQEVGSQTVANAVSAAVYLHTHKTNSDPMTVYWDEVLFADSTPSAVSLHSFAAQPAAQQGWLWWGGGVGITAVFLLFFSRRRRQ